MRKKLAIIISFALLAATLAIGCQNAAQKPIIPNQRSDQSENTDNMMSDNERQAMAARLANMAESIEGVDSATVIVSNNGILDNNVANNGSISATDRENLNRDIRNNSNISLRNNVNNISRDESVNVMVGLTLNRNVSNNSNMEKSIKQSVNSKLKASDRRISELMVTTDPELTKEIDRVASGVSAGKPLQTFNRELNNLNQNLKQQEDVFTR